MAEKQKYVRLQEYDNFIFFPQIIEHSTFKHMNPISAGFCYFDDELVRCFGDSYSLGIGSTKDDSKLATKQVFGIDAMLNLFKED